MISPPLLGFSKVNRPSRHIHKVTWPVPIITSLCQLQFRWSSRSSAKNRLTDIWILGIKAKVENKQQYNQYVEELKDLREELGVNLKEDLYPGDSDIVDR
jgi:hypothetical protein